MSCPENLGDPHPAVEDIPISALRAEKCTCEDIFISNQPRVSTSGLLSEVNDKL